MVGTPTLFHNGVIVTMDPQRPEQRWLLARDGRVERIGGGEPPAMAGVAFVNLDGRTVLPGFVDAHNHFSLSALEPLSVDCRAPPAASMDALLERVHEAAATLPPGRWLRGHGYDDLALGGHPTREQLDAVAPEHPVVLVHWSVHRCVANGAALRAAGPDERDGDPPGGWIVRGPAGSPTGLLYERATDPLQAASIEAYAGAFGAELPALFRANAGAQLAAGITALGDAYVHPALAGVYDAAALPLGVRPFCGSERGLFAPPEECVAGIVPPPPPGALSRGVKLFADGGGNTTATSLASGRPPRFLFYRQEELNALVAAAHAQAMPVAIHAAGDIAVGMALSAFEYALHAHPHTPPRFRIEHAITIQDADIGRLAALGVSLVTQPAAVFHSGASVAAAPLAEGVRVAPFRDLIRAGVNVAFSSDSPCYALPPLWQAWCAVTRATVNGGALADGQAVRAEQALTAYTRGGAQAIFDRDRGTLRPGARADLLVLSRDPRTTPLTAWRSIVVERVFTDGVERELESSAALPGRHVPDWG